MCGICGYSARQRILDDELKAMNNTMLHRGPNDSGEETFFAANRWVGLAHRRLSIQDLSPLGHQPMHSAGKEASIVFNGEIYNYKELKKQLDYPFVSNCDTEVIVAAYLKWGKDCLQHFNGMFAFVIYDHRDNSMFMARDRIGKKPLYYWKEDAVFAFASELKAIMAYPGFTKQIRQEVLPRYLYQGYIAAPDTIFKNVYKLPAGHFALYKNGELNQYCYWDITKVYHSKKATPVTSYGQAKEELHHILKQAVKRRMIADVPLGSFLSGGYDSSLVSALAQSVSDEPLKTYCIGFEEKELNEAGFAKQVAQHLGTKHTELYVQEEEMRQLVESIPQYYDEPFGDDSQIPTMLVSQLARQDVTVALSGDGGDEFFCGYSLYNKLPKVKQLDGIGGLLHAICNAPPLRRAQLLKKLPDAVQVIAENRDKETKVQFGNGFYPALARQIAGQGLPEKYREEVGFAESNWQVRRMLLDMKHFLPEDILCKVDRASMKYSIEARCPILDVEVMEYSFGLPHAFKYANGQGKRILRDITYEYIPKDLLDRPKRGFDVPTEKWLRGSLKERLLAFSQPSILQKQGLFAPETADIIKEYVLNGEQGPGQSGRYTKLVWNYFVFQLWYEKYIEIL